MLGTRWFCDALGDSVYPSGLAGAALQGGTEVEQHRDGSDGPVPTAAHVRGGGEPGAAIPDLARLAIEVVRVLDGSTDAAVRAALRR